MPDRQCSIDGCKKKTVGRGWCSTHWSRWQRTGDPLRTPRFEPKQPCSIDGCKMKVLARGWCSMHYARWHRTGDSLWTPRFQPKFCSIDGCEKRVKARGWCSMHLSRSLRHGDPLWTPPSFEPRFCSMEGCEKRVESRGWCGMHYQRWRVHGDPIAVGRNRYGLGRGRTMDRNGYVKVKVNEKMKPEHRVVMEDALGRSLADHENVHHINGDRADNRLENLELWSTSQPSGQRIEDKVAWAKELLALYDGKLLGAKGGEVVAH